MTGRLYCGFIQPTKFFHRAASVSLLEHKSNHFTFEKTITTANKNIVSMQRSDYKVLDYEVFKKKLKSFEEFKSSPEIIKLYKNNEETLKRVYEDDCTCKYNRYKNEQYGGNPGTMI
jgi:hypothetical protein